jgi:hypothetical protein
MKRFTDSNPERVVHVIFNKYSTLFRVAVAVDNLPPI